MVYRKGQSMRWFHVSRLAALKMIAFTIKVRFELSIETVEKIAAVVEQNEAGLNDSAR